MQKVLIHNYFPMILERPVPHNMFKQYLWIHISCTRDMQKAKLGSMMSMVISLFLSLQLLHYPSQLRKLDHFLPIIYHFYLIFLS
jgi:hypothetical protein